MIAWSGLGTWSGLPVFAAAFWKSGVVLGAALGASALLRRKSADLRRLVLSISVGAMFVAAAVAPAMPRWTAAAPAWFRLSTSASPARWGQPPGPVVDKETGLLPAQDHHLPSPQSRIGVLVRLPNRVPVMPLVWIAGAGILLARFLVGLCELRRLRIASRPLSDDGLLAGLGGPGHGRRVSLLESETIGAPVTWGIIRPVILVPARFEHLPPEHRTQVLCHELAHIQGHDFLLRVLAEVARAVIWFQPLMWIARRQLREEQELACDDRVVAAGGKSSAYAKLLLDWNGAMSGRDALVAVGMAQRSCLKRRLYALLDLNTRRGTASPAAIAALWFAGLATALPVAAVNFAPEAAPRPRAEPAFHAAALETRPLRSSVAAAPQVAMTGVAPDDVPQDRRPHRHRREARTN
jgi:beta-lactamase regulating signal transducer with metallopeptidase domain